MINNEPSMLYKAQSRPKNEFSILDVMQFERFVIIDDLECTFVFLNSHIFNKGNFEIIYSDYVLNCSPFNVCVN